MIDWGSTIAVMTTIFEMVDVGRTMAGFCLAYFISRELVFKPAAVKWIPVPNDDESKKSSALLTRQKFVASAWKFFSYCFLIGVGVWAVWDQQEWFWNPLSYHDAYPGNKIPFGISTLYLLEIGYYLFALVTMFIEPGQKDFWAMFSHHLFTLTLLISSFQFGATKYGTAIMILHDLADPIMELAKISLYLKYEMAANVIFAVFAATFIVLRDYIYPRYIIWNTNILLRDNDYQFREVTVGCLLALWVLHLFWTILIIKVALNALSGNQKGDVRDKDD